MNYSDLDTSRCRLTQTDWDIISSTARGFYVEVGSFHGASALAASIKADRVITVDIFDWQPKLFKPGEKITFFKGTSVDFAEELKNSGELIDVLFIDGSHEYDSVKKDCEALVPFVKIGGTVMFHDHNPNNPNTGVYPAVNEFLTSMPHEALPKIPGSSNLLTVIKK